MLYSRIQNNENPVGKIPAIDTARFVFYYESTDYLPGSRKTMDKNRLLKQIGRRSLLIAAAAAAAAIGSRKILARKESEARKDFLDSLNSFFAGKRK